MSDDGEIQYGFAKVDVGRRGPRRKSKNSHFLWLLLEVQISIARETTVALIFISHLQC